MGSEMLDGATVLRMESSGDVKFSGCNLTD